MRSSVDLHVSLLGRGIAHEFFRIPHRVRSPEDAAVILGADPGAFAIGSVFVAPNGLAVMGVAPAGVAVDAAALMEASGVRGLRHAYPLATSRLTGFPTGWEPPVAIDDALATVLDSSLADQPVIYGPGGEPGSIVGIRTADLIGAGALVAPVTTTVAFMK